MAYDELPFETLQGFVASRRLQGTPAHKDALVFLLERADDNIVFEHLMDLPPELRVRVYEYHFGSFDFVSAEPAPILQLCRLVRKEARPIFYESTRLRVVIGYDLWSNVPNNNRFGRCGLCYRLFEELDIDCLSRINELTLKYVWAGTHYFDIDLLAEKDELLVKRAYFDAIYGIDREHNAWHHASAADDSSAPDAEAFMQLCRIAKDIAAKPCNQKLQRGDLLRFSVAWVRDTL